MYKRQAYVNARFDLIAERSDKTEKRNDSLADAILGGREDEDENDASETQTAAKADRDYYKERMQKRMDELEEAE